MARLTLIGDDQSQSHVMHKCYLTSKHKCLFFSWTYCMHFLRSHNKNWAVWNSCAHAYFWSYGGRKVINGAAKDGWAWILLGLPAVAFRRLAKLTSNNNNNFPLFKMWVHPFECICLMPNKFSFTRVLWYHVWSNAALISGQSLISQLKVYALDHIWIKSEMKFEAEWTCWNSR